MKHMLGKFNQHQEEVFINQFNNNIQMLQDIKDNIKNTGNYVTIDFETGNPNGFSMCSVGIVTVENFKVVDVFTSLIRPPYNDIRPKFTQIHGISHMDTQFLCEFPDVYEKEIHPRLKNKWCVAHNESFDRRILQSTMRFFDIPYNELELLNPEKWDCTMRIYKGQYKFLSGALKYLCNDLGIQLDHHKAESDALACSELYNRHLKDVYTIINKQK